MGSTPTFTIDGTVYQWARLRDGIISTSPGQLLKIDVYGFKYDIGGNRGIFEGALSQSVTDDDVNYVYIDGEGSLQINTTGFPADTHIPLASIVTANGAVTNIYEERVLLAASSAAVGECWIGFPVDGGVRGGNSAVSSNNNIPSVTFAPSGLSTNKWNCRIPKNYISGDLKFRCLGSVAGTPGSNNMRLGIKWGCYSAGDTLPSDYSYNVAITTDYSEVQNDVLFEVDITIPDEYFDSSKNMFAIQFYRDGDHADDTTGLTYHTHMCGLVYTGYKVAGQAGQ